MSYKLMKVFKHIKNIQVYYSNTEFRRYSIHIDGHGDGIWIYQNKKPTIKELRQYIKENN